MTYLRSFRLPDEMRDQLSEEAQAQGRSVNRLVVETMRLVLAGETVVTAAPNRAQAELVATVAEVEVRPKAKPAKAKKDAEPPKKPNPGKFAKEPSECRHGIPHCRICLTGRYAAE